MIGYYMGESQNLMTMMQTGGDAAIQRALQQRDEIDAIESAQRDEAKRQGRGRLFGSIGGIAGGLLGAALAPATGGLSLAVPAAIGTALGKGVGERLGAGRAKRSDRPEGTFFYGDTFSDIDEASREFNQGILGRAGMAGLKAGVTAGLSPGGGIYGKVAGKLRPDQLAGVGMEGASAVASQAVDPYAQFGDFTTATLPKSSIAQTTSGLAPKLDTSGVFDASQQFNQTALNIAQQEAAGSKAYVDTLQRLSSPEGRAELGLIQESFDPTPDINLIEALGVSIPQASRSVDLSNNFFNPVSFEDTLVASDRLGAMNRELDALRSLQESRESLSRSAGLQSRLLDYLQSSQSQPLVAREDGGLIEYQNGGLTEKLFDDYSNFTLPSNETESGDPTTGSGFASTSPIMSTITNPASFTSADIDVKKIAAEMGLEISDADAAKYYEGYDLSEIAPAFDAQRMAIGNVRSDIRDLGAQTGFTSSGFGGNLLSSAQESARQAINKTRVASVEDFKDRIKRQLAADIASGVSGIRRIGTGFDEETLAELSDLDYEDMYG